MIDYYFIVVNELFADVIIFRFIVLIKFNRLMFEL